MTRAITFAGPLGFGDCTLGDDGLVTISRAQAPAASRSPRPGMKIAAAMTEDIAGLPVDRACQVIAASLPVPGEFEPGRDLEAWLLPLTDFTFQFLVTPADPS